MIGHYATGVAFMLRDAARASRRLRRYEESEARLKRAVEVYERFYARDGQHCWDKRALFTFKQWVSHRLGITYSEMGRHAEAEKALRQAIAGFETVPRIYGKNEQSPAFFANIEEAHKDATDSLAIVLRDLGKGAEADKLVDDTARPAAVRQLLGPAATDAEVAAFDVQAALTVPLPDLKAVDALDKWQGFELGKYAYSYVGQVNEGRRALIAVKVRLINRYAELQGENHPRMVALVRSLLHSHDYELPLKEMEELYRLQASAPINMGEERANADPGGLANRLGRRLVQAAPARDDADMMRRGVALLEEAVAVSERLVAEGNPFVDLSGRLGDLGETYLQLGDPVAAEAAFERALAAAQAKWGEELLDSEMVHRNAGWVAVYSTLLEANADAKKAQGGAPEDKAAAARRMWIGLLAAKLEGKEQQVADQSLLELRAAIRKAKRDAAAAAVAATWQEEEATAAGSGGVGGGDGGKSLSRKARQKLEAQRRAAEAKRLKKERAQARAQEEAARAAAKAAAKAAAGGGGGGEGYAQAEPESVAAAPSVSASAAVAMAAAAAEAGGEEAEEECAICLFELGEGDGAETLSTCGHTFHWTCLGQWRDTCQSKELPLNCPYCRQKM
jgi:tetratricopeptide (TPR) repeat protein